MKFMPQVRFLSIVLILFLTNSVFALTRSTRGNFGPKYQGVFVASSPWKDVTHSDYGAIGDGVTDDATAIQAAIDDMPTVGGILFFPPGTYLCSSAIAHSSKQFSVFGSGMDNTVIKKNFNGDFFEMSEAYWNFVSRITFDFNSKTGKGLYFGTTVNYQVIRDVVFKNANGTGAANAALHNNSNGGMNLWNVWFVNNDQHAYIYENHAFHAYNLDISGNNGTVAYNSFWVEDTVEVDIHGLTVQSDTGLSFERCTNVSINGGYLEGPLTSASLITFGDTGSITRGISVKNINMSKSGTNTAVGSFMDFKNVWSYNNPITLEDIQLIGTHGTIDVGAIKFSDNVRGLKARGISARNTSATIQSTGILKFDGVLYDSTIENVIIESGTGDTPTIALANDVFRTTFRKCSADTVQMAITLPKDCVSVTFEDCEADITITDDNQSNILLKNCSGTITDAGEFATQMRGGEIIAQPITALANDATPSVSGHSQFVTGGTTTITDFDDGLTGHIITIRAAHSVTITDGTNIFLNGSTNFAMTSSDTLTLRCESDNKWYEISRGDNGA